MTKIEIKSISGDILFTYESENATIKDAVEKAVEKGISLNRAMLTRASLDGAYLNNASLIGASLIGASLNFASLDGALLDRASLGGASLDYASLIGASIDNTYIFGASLIGVSLIDVKNKETALLPLFCNRSFSIYGSKIKIGCKIKTIEEWDDFFESSEEYQIKRDTQEFKQIQAVYNACKAYLLTLNQE